MANAAALQRGVPRKVAIESRGATYQTRFPLIMFIAVFVKNFVIDLLVFSMFMVALPAAKLLAVGGGLLSILPVGRIIGFFTRLVGRTATTAGVSLEVLVVLFVAFGIVVTLAYTVAFLLWFFFKPNSVQRAIGKKVLWGIAFVLMLGFIPGIGFIVPGFTILVLYTYFQEKKFAQKRPAEI